MYDINLDVEGLEDDGQNMYSNTYLTKLRNTPISSEPYVDIEEDLDVMMARIIKRTIKCVEWTMKKGRSKRKTTQASPATATPTSSQSATPSVATTTTQGPAQFATGGDQTPEKNILIAPTFQGSSLPVIGTQVEAEKGTEEPKDGATTRVSPSHATLPPSPHATPIPSSHITPISSPHHSPTPCVSASLLNLASSPIQIVEIGDDKSSSSESTESNEAEKKTREEEKALSSSRLLS